MFELPLFPLNTVLFPGMPLSLQVFEERYRIMMQRVLQTNYTFGVNLIRNGTEALGPLPEPFEIGCTARVVQAEPLGDGRLNLTVVGDERFRIVRLGAGQPYLTAFVESLPLESHHTLEVVRGSHVLRRRLMDYLILLSHHGQHETEGQEVEISVDLPNLQLPEDPMMLMYMAGSLLQVPSAEKQPILEANTATKMLEMLQRILRREIAILPPTLSISPEQARVAAWNN
jgi:uncharacterized protein